MDQPFLAAVSWRYKCLITQRDSPLLLLCFRDTLQFCTEMKWPEIHPCVCVEIFSLILSLRTIVNKGTKMYHAK